MRNGKNIRGALSYNEAKVREGKAELILASRFGCEAADLNFSQKLKRFTDLNAKCLRSVYNTVHISLNFSPDDRIDTEQMQLIARSYMQQLGFEKQPYLVYRHDDTGHPHLHIVTTPVRAGGSTINLHKLVQRTSEPARLKIEEDYQLIKAEGRSKATQLQPVDPKVIEYGKAETKHAISHVVRSVVSEWKFTSFAEFNLVLRQYGVQADSGKPGERIHERKGLQYYLVDQRGKRVSVAIKASSIYTSPTLKNIEKRFAANDFKKQARLEAFSKSVQYAVSRSDSQARFFSALREKNIAIIDNNGSRYFFEHRTKTIASATELGVEGISFGQHKTANDHEPTFDLSLLQKLLDTTYTGPDLAAAFLKRKRKKKR